MAIVANVLSSRLIMLTRLLYLLVLVTYVNTVFYQDGHIHGDNARVIDGAPLMEIILEDILDIPCADEEDVVNVFQYDDYRPASSKWISIAPPRGLAGLVPMVVSDVSHDDYGTGVNSKISCLIGYYRFLFRLKPF